MDPIIINVSLAFLEGLGLIVSPCILPVLPIIFATGIIGGKYKPYGIMLGFIIAFCLFTLFARAIVASTGVNLDIVRTASFIILLFLAIIMMSTYLSDAFSRVTQRLSNYGASISTGQKKEGGFLNGIFVGLPIGLIWTPCAGPIIAAVIVQTIRAKTNLETILTLLAFSLGVAIPILLIILFGKKILNRHSFITAHAVSIRKILGGALFLAVILNMQGSLYFSAADIKASGEQLQSEKLISPLTETYAAPEIADIAHWINSPPLQISQLKGTVILIDFWTYSCINCVRTLPYLKDWYHKYKAKGFVIIGVHSPEFAFEEQFANVQNAVKKLGILYPVALDNKFRTWYHFENHFWPAHYLINKQGKVVYTHFGEGQYDVTEHNIQILLGEKPVASTAANTPLKNVLTFTPTTPETYLGSDRSSNFQGQFSASQKMYEYPKELNLNNWSLKGQWQILPQKIISKAKGSSIKLHFQAQNVFLVLGSQDNQVKTATLLLNGKPMKLIGSTFQKDKLIIKDATLYQLISLPKHSDGILEIIFDQPGTEAYAFTFG